MVEVNKVLVSVCSLISLMPLFDEYVAIDFSGSKDPARQRNGIVLAEIDRAVGLDVQGGRFTRFEAALYLMQRVVRCHSNGKRILFGFAFRFAFPCGFWPALTGRSETWGDVVRDLADGIPQLPAIAEKPESNAGEWVEIANKKLSHKFQLGIGPLWGPGSSQIKDPHFPFTKVPFSEYRLTEQRRTGFKPIFKIGGQGAVGLQSLCGLPYLHHIKTTCRQQKVPLHCWPFDGWDIGNSAQVMVEWYPALYNEAPKSHKSDALACVNWAMELDSREELSSYFVPDLSKEEAEKAVREGWVLGIL